MYSNYDYLGAVNFLGTVNINGVPLSQVNTASTLVAYNATVSDAYTIAQPNRHITLAGNSSITVTGGLNGDSGLWYLYGTGIVTLNNTDASTLVVPVSGNLKVVYFLVDKDNNLTWYQDENSGGSGAVAVQTATGDGTTTINWTVSPFMDFTFGAFNEIITMTPPAYPERLRLKLTQDGVGSRTVTWGNNFYVPSGIMPTLSTGAGDIDVVNLFWNGIDFEIDEDFLDYQLVAGVDSEAPTAPTGLASSNVTETTLDLTWTAATDNFAVTNYKVYQDALEIASLGNVLTYNVTGLTASTAYAFTVTALDSAANESLASNTVTETTSTPSSYDIDAQAVIDAITTLTVPEEVIVNNLVLGLKSSGMWAKSHAIYGMIGGTASSVKFNWKNPLDTDAAFRLVPTGTITYTSVGADGDGTTGYFNTNYTPSINGTAQNVHLSFYSTEDVAVNGFDIGSNNGGVSQYLQLSFKNSGAKFRSYTSYGNGELFAADRNPTTGWLVGSRLSETDASMYYNATLIATKTATLGSQPTLNMYILGNNDNGTASSFSGRTCAFASIGLGLTSQEVTDSNTVIQAFITAKEGL